MSQVQLYESSYGSASDPAQVAVRLATYGEDFGQTGWMTGEEHDQIIRLLSIGEKDHVLEVACGAGGAARRLARLTGALVTGVDVNPHAIFAAQKSPHDRVQFVRADADERLVFADGRFDAIYCNDAVNHLRDRRKTLQDWARLLTKAGRLFFTDPVVITGPVSNAQLAGRSSIGHFLFLPAGLNEQLLAATGFVVERVMDMTEALVGVSHRWRAAREAQRPALIRLESAEQFEATQRFLSCVNELGSQRRLSRMGYLAIKQ